MQGECDENSPHVPRGAIQERTPIGVTGSNSWKSRRRPLKTIAGMETILIIA